MKRSNMICGDKKRKQVKYRLAAAVILLVISAVLMVTASGVPQFANWYSRTVYPVLVSAVGRVMGVFPFSVAEICLYLLILGLLFSVILCVRRIVRDGHAGSVLYRWFAGVMLTVSILAFLYTAGCGINYHRRSFSEEEGIITFEYTVEDLQKVCVWLTVEVNKRASSVSRDGEGVMALDAPEGSGAVEAMERLGEIYPALAGYYPQPKKVTVSEILSYQGLTGVYSPFTVEANYNGDMTPYNVPFTVCHELSHLRGFMQEQEANFIAFLACTGSDRTDFQYSGYLSAWVYCMNALYRADAETWQGVRALLDVAAEPDLAANNSFWDSYRGVVSETADRINDTYLKANGQADGVKSYNRMVDLIVAYYLQ